MKVLGWLLSVFFAMAALGGLLSGERGLMVTGATAAAIAMIFAPPIGARLRAASFRGAGALLIVVIAGLGGALQGELPADGEARKERGPQKEEPSKRAAPSAAPTLEVVAVQAEASSEGTAKNELSSSAADEEKPSETAAELYRRVLRQENYAAYGAWASAVKTNQLDDSQSIYLSSLALEPYVYMGRETTPTLILRCISDVTSIVFGLNGYISTQGVPVTTRVDKRPISTQIWEIASNHESVGLWDGGQAIPFIKSMLGSDQILLQITPYGENPQTFTFETYGIDTAIGPLRDACHW